MSYQIISNIHLLNREAKLELSVDDHKKGLGELTFYDWPLDLKMVLNDLIEDISKNDASFKSPFDISTFPDLQFIDFKIETFDNGTDGSGMALLGESTLNGNAFTVKYGTYAPINGKGKTPQSFSLLLNPFIIDHIPVVNVHLDQAIKIDIKELGVVTAPFYDETKRKVERGFYIRGSIEIDGKKTDLIYPGAGKSAGSKMVQATGTANSGRASGKAKVTKNTKSSKGGIKWININKRLGPANLKQIGVQWKNGKVWLLVNAGISFGGIELDIMGLKAGEAIGFPPKIPVFGIDGLGLAFNKGGVEIAGEFFKANPTLPGVTSQYDGMLEIKFEEVLIEGLGSYAKINGHDSIFAYAYLDYPLGGPAFFFVEGLALGFGYNRQLILPPLKKVKSFPLVSQAISTKPFGKKNDPLKALSELDVYIPPKEGETLLMVGIKFSTFQVLNSFLLLSADFGADTRFDLIGLSLLSLPPDEKEYPIVFVEIALEASVDPSKGFVKVDGLITNKSYIYVKEAHLSGGFAFYSWFKDQAGKNAAKAGDFVVSLGGYNPKFKKPDYYPNVPRFELNWRVDSRLDVKAKAYFAMTPRYGMAGFEMQAVYNDGSLSADFKAGADFLIQWKPFHYDITAYVSLHAAFTASIDLVFTTVHKTFHLDMGANLHLWGPKLTGHADVHVRVLGVGFSFGVNFGAGSSTPPPLNWDEFKASFLPKDKSVGLQITATDGLIKTVDDIWILNPHTLQIKAESVFPVSSFTSNMLTKDTESPDAFAIGPMHKKKSSSNLDFNLYKKGKSTENGKFRTKINMDLAYTKASKNMPAALWAYQEVSDINAPSLLDLTNGVILKPTVLPESGHSKFVNASALQYATSLMKKEHNHWSDNNSKVVDTVFEYDKMSAADLLHDFNPDKYKQMNMTTLKNIQKTESFRATPVVVNLLA